jgi:hypothetical protein
LYQLLVIISVAAGVWGVRALIGLVKARSWAYRETLLVLVVGGAAALIQIIASRSLRGASMPTDVRLYVTILTLLVFLFLRLPGVWEVVNFTDQKSNLKGVAGGLATISLGMMALTVQHWAGPSHTFNGLNYSDVWSLPLTVSGWALIIFGAALVARSAPQVSKLEKPFISNQTATVKSL